MPETEITVQNVDVDGLDLDLTTAAETDGNYFVHNNRAILMVVNDNATLARQVTIKNQKDCEYSSSPSEHDIVTSVPALKTYAFNLGNDRFKDVNFLDKAGYVHVEYDSAADLSVAVIKRAG